MNYSNHCDELIFALTAHVAPRVDRAILRAKEDGVTFAAAYLRNRLDEIGGKSITIADNSTYSREQFYYIINGKRPLTGRAAAAVSETYPDIPLSELIAVIALTTYEKAQEDE